MSNPAMPAAAQIPAHTLARAFEMSGAVHWDVSREAFAEALARSLAHRFGTTTPAPAAVDTYIDSLHLQDLALAVACAAGNEAAWERFVADYRPRLERSAQRITAGDSSVDLVDSLYGDLFGLDERDTGRRSLFRYYHGRSALSTWLHAVLARRHVDHLRSARRHVSLDAPDAPPTFELPAASPPADPDRARLATAFDEALTTALGTLDARDRLRLSLYYIRQLKLAAIGRLLGEHEATVSRHLDRVRRSVRSEVERALAESHRLRPDEVRACFETALEERPLDLTVALTPGEATP